MSNRDKVRDQIYHAHSANRSTMGRLKILQFLFSLSPVNEMNERKNIFMLSEKPKQYCSSRGSIYVEGHWLSIFTDVLKLFYSFYSNFL